MDKLDFLFELGTEELPPTALSTLSAAFYDGIKSELSAQQLDYDQLTGYATPRRLAILISGLATSQPDSEQTRLGPALAAAFDAEGKPTKAAEGFARSCGLSATELEHIDTEKGVRLGVVIKNKGKSSEQLIVPIIEKALASLPIPKGMRWGDRDETFVRPVKWIVAMMGERVLDMTLFGCRSANTTRGHRFMSEGEITIPAPAAYADTLRKAHVIADQNERKALITEQVNHIAQENSLTPVIDSDLLDEVSALVEWPVALMGQFEEAFLSVPKEALISTMAKNQKYFHLLTEGGELANRFITISNLVSTNPAAIIEGNERVIRPRLADAKFFFQQDSKQSLTVKSHKLESIVFQSKLGSVADKCRRVETIGLVLARTCGANETEVAQAAKICKADLVSEMVGEFPNLQGIMGNYYARNEGLPTDVCQALEEIYLPKSATDALPQTKVGITLALADRIDTLVGIFGIGQLPTGNKDPYALRRAALGIVRIIQEHAIDLDIQTMIQTAVAAYDGVELSAETEQQLLEFFSSRNRALYLDKGFTAQMISAVEALNIFNPTDFDRRVVAVRSFVELPQADTLSAANKRVANILSKNASEISSSVNEDLLQDESETRLYDVYRSNQDDVIALCKSHNYVDALEQLTSFADPLDAFFTDVMVMVDDERIKANRIALLNAVRAQFLAVADISYLQK
ncbi:MAG: glycine--tRNA ligase subunit beta [Gammaproteobacteria bacterium]